MSIKVVLNKKGVSEMLFSPEMEALVRERADEAVSSLGEGYEAYTLRGHDRIQAGIRAASYAARKDNLEHNTILKALK